MLSQLVDSLSRAPEVRNEGASQWDLGAERLMSTVLDLAWAFHMYEAMR